MYKPNVQPPAADIKAVKSCKLPWCVRTVPALLLVLSRALFAQADPWTASANNLKAAFTGPIATALIAVAVVVTGMVFAFSEGQGKRQLAGLTFGGAMALGAVRFMAWLFT